jgi:hypothetical protein
MTDYDDTLYLVRYNNSIMYIGKSFTNMEACNKYIFRGKYTKSKSISDKIEELYNYLIKKGKT